MPMTSAPTQSPALARPSARASARDWADTRLLIHETYLSVQGESTFVGVPCVFIRLTGCPLRCVWCDTEHAFTGGQRMAAGAVVEEALAYQVPLIEVTGGEPLAQPGCIDLLHGLVAKGAKVLLETSGAFPIEEVPQEVHVIMDLKCPDSGEMDRNLPGNIDWLRPTDEVKFVIASRRDFDWAAAQVRLHGLDQRVGAILFSPVFGSCIPRDLVAWMLEDRTPGVRMQIQAHKVIWPPDTRGV